MDIKELIPQREPFLFVDKVIDQTDSSITTTHTLTGEEDFFKGHFPGDPVMPGVLLCEACFQTGALLMSQIIDGGLTGLTVVSRIQSAKFKNMVVPPGEMTIYVELKDQVGPAAYMKGKVTYNNKTALQIEFAVTLTEKK